MDTNCYMFVTKPRQFYNYRLFVFNAGHVGSLLVAAVSIVFYVRHNNKVNPVKLDFSSEYLLSDYLCRYMKNVQVAGSGAVPSAAARNQRDMTKRVAWSCVASLILVVIPVQVRNNTVLYE